MHEYHKYTATEQNNKYNRVNHLIFSESYYKSIKETDFVVIFVFGI